MIGSAIMLRLLLRALLLSTATARHEDLIDLYRGYQHSVSQCRHGQRVTENGAFGVLILFVDEASRSNVLRNTTSILHHATDKIEASFHSFPALAASLTLQTISELLSSRTFDQLLSAGGLEADCIRALDDPREQDPKSKLTVLAATPTGAWIQQSAVDAQSVQPSAPWGLDRIDARSGRDGTYTYGTAMGASTRIYVLDTGVRISHDDFGGRAVAGWSPYCTSGAESSCASSDGSSGYFVDGVIPASGVQCSGHGTHCASTAAGLTYGVAKGATVVTVQVLSCEGTGTGSGVIAGIEWAAADAQSHSGQRSVISMSLGGGASAVENAAVAAAVNGGVSVVVAAGNDDDNACSYSPASESSAITVASTTWQDVKSSFSNHGPCVDIWAPGSSITAAWVTSDTATATISGTSMACPHVAGAVALLRSAQPSLTSLQIDTAIKCMATNGAIGSVSSDTVNKFLYAGAVMVDSSATACIHQPSSPQPPPLPPSPPVPTPSFCDEACSYASDNECDDGGPGAEYAECALGTDCTDCGSRAPPPLSTHPAPPPPLDAPPPSPSPPPSPLPPRRPPAAPPPLPPPPSTPSPSPPPPQPPSPKEPPAQPIGAPQCPPPPPSRPPPPCPPPPPAPPPSPWPPPRPPLPRRPGCPCPIAWLGDGQCDGPLLVPNCNIIECGFDGGDCAPPPPPPPPRPPAKVCSCQSSWLVQSGGTLYEGRGCDNPDGDPYGAWCRSVEGEGCLLPHGGISTSFWYYCGVTAIPSNNTGITRTGDCNAPLDVRLQCAATSLYPLDISPIVPWCLRRSCENGTRSVFNNSETWCPAGMVCPNSNDDEQTACPSGFYCPEGSIDPNKCSSDLFGVVSRAQRCPAGAAAPSRGFSGLVQVLLLLGLPLMLLLEYIQKRTLARPKVKGKLKAVIADVVKQQKVLSAMRPADRSLPAMIEKAVGRFFAQPMDQNNSAGAAAASASGDALNMATIPKQTITLQMEWSDLSFRIGRATVLSVLDGQASHGELIALMGESGSGKSTLLNVLGGRANYGRRSGHLHLNGRPHKNHELRHIVGFVPQNYVLFEELTVFENLLYSAMLRGPRDETRVHRHRRILGLLYVLGLRDVRDFIVDKNIGMGRLSGGQMRRTSIGVELAAASSMLLCDEPTSALDAVNTHLVCCLLRALANSGMLVVCSIHQPRTSVFEMFDKLFLLRRGQMAYGGEVRGVEKYFASLGYPLPTRANPADFFIEVCFGFVDSAKAGVEAAHLAPLWKAKYHALQEQQRASEPSGNATVTFDTFKAYWQADPLLSRIDLQACAHVYQQCDTNRTWKSLLHKSKTMALPRSKMPTTAEQVRVCTKRCLLKRLRTRWRFGGQLLMMVTLSVIAGIILGTEVPTDTAMLSAIVALFGVYVSTLSIESVSQGASDELFSHESAGGVRQRCEISARLIVDVITWIFLPLVYVLPLASLANFGAAMTGEMLGIMYMLQWAMQPLGYVITCIDRKNATVAVSSVALVLTIFLNTQLGPSLKDVPTLLAFSPARWATPALCLSYIVHTPFCRARALLENAMLETGVIANGFDLRSLPSGNVEVLQQLRTVVQYTKHASLQEHLNFCAGMKNSSDTPRTALGNSSASATPVQISIAEEYGSLASVHWYREALVALFLMGFLLRIVTVAAFCKRTHSWRELPMLGITVVWLTRAVHANVVAKEPKDLHVVTSATPPLDAQLLEAQRLPPPGAAQPGADPGTSAGEAAPAQGMLAWLNQMLADAEDDKSASSGKSLFSSTFKKVDRSFSKMFVMGKAKGPGKLRTQRSHRIDDGPSIKDKPPSSRPNKNAEHTAQCI